MVDWRVDSGLTGGSACRRHVSVPFAASLQAPTMWVAVDPTCPSSLAHIPRGLDAAAILSTCFRSQRGVGPTHSIPASHFWPLVRRHASLPFHTLSLSLFFFFLTKEKCDFFSKKKKTLLGTLFVLVYTSC